MKPDATRFFVCPQCKGDLTVHATESGEIESGELECRSCSKSYPIVRGVPRFVDKDSYADTFGRQWTRWKRTQQDSINGTGIFRERMQRYSGWTPDSFDGKVVVDCGCGPGGFLDVVRGASALVGFDLSVAVDSAYELHGKRPEVYLAQGDIFSPPVRPAVADRVYTFGVVQHTPNPEGAFRSLIPLVKPGGEISVWVYRKWPVPQPSYWLRRFTAGMPEPKATEFIEWYTPRAMGVSRLINRIPRVGNFLKRLVPVADYEGRLHQLDEEQLREWALMDTHDLLITRYTYPQSWRDLQRWTRDLENLRRPTGSEMAAVARRPLSAVRAASSSRQARV